MSTVPYPSRPPVGMELSSGPLLPEISFTLGDFVEDGAIAWLELQLVISVDTDRAVLPGLIAELIRSTSQREEELGGMGLVLDREASSVNASGLTLVLRPLDVRGSKKRLEQQASEITATNGTASPPPAELQNLTDLLHRVWTSMQNDPLMETNGRNGHRFSRTIATVRIHSSTRRGQLT